MHESKVITIIKNDAFILRKGSLSKLQKEDIVEQFPKDLQGFAPQCMGYEECPDFYIRKESHMGSPHEHPSQMIQDWWDARMPHWRVQPQQTLTLQQWLKQLWPHCNIKISNFMNQWRSLCQEQHLQNPFPLKSNALQQALQKNITVSLYQGLTHRNLCPSRIREKGFISWSSASLKGYRGEDVAGFWEVQGQPIDVLLHMVKWGFKHDPIKAVDALLELGLLQYPIPQVHLKIHHSPALRRKDVEKMLGCQSGMVPTQKARHALYRAQKLQIGGHPIQVECHPLISPLKDPLFFLPRNRKRTELFDKWHQGIKVDDQGTYSLTAQKHAKHIASLIQCQSLYEPFAGCGGNSIAFGLEANIQQVWVNELDATRCEYLRHNAKIYGIHNLKITCHDATQHFPEADFVFVDPPWEWGHQKLRTLHNRFQNQYAHGMFKAPIDYPIHPDEKARIYLTSENFPSFLLVHWSR